MSDTPTEPVTRPYAPPPLSADGPVEAQLAELRAVVARMDRDVHDLAGARHRHAAGQVRLEAQVRQLQGDVGGLRGDVAGLAAEIASLRPALAQVARVMSWGGGIGFALMSALQAAQLMQGGG